MPNLVVVTGLPRAGKSTVASLASEVLGIETQGVLDTDTLRKDAIREGLISYESRYAPVPIKLVYNIMIARAEKRLEEGFGVIVSATFANHKNLDKVRRLAERARAQLHIFFVDCDEVTIKERLSKGIPLRNDGSNGSDLPSVYYPGDDSEAGEEVYLAIKKIFSPPENPALVIDGTAPAIDTMRALTAYFHKDREPILAF